MAENGTWVHEEISVWLDPTGGVTIKAVTPQGDPVELSSSEARRLATILTELAAQDDK